MHHDKYISILGTSCRLPGAADMDAFRAVLQNGTFTPGALPQGRWSEETFYHPVPRTRGHSVTFVGGYLPDPYDFDLSVFGISPREAAQMDPQQRLIAELVWEALEDARIAPAAIAGSEVGVYIGVSALDHANLFGGDPGAIESHFMTGNTLSVVANRISYLFDLRGPSFVVDTACSSSLVAVDRAVADIRAGRIDMAIVGGVNMLLSPASFIGFSQASMLSPTGMCRPFSGDGDGYVRAEGGAVFILQRGDITPAGAARAYIVGTAVNSDGRTSGIALPALRGQRALLERAYRDAEIDPNALAFVEAHGTGTVVGDPIEAMALGEVLGRNRTNPLPIGSVKSNIGHLEPASGVAGMAKALIALEDRRLPATLHLDRLNPLIDFERLNVLPARLPVDLGDGDVLHCGVSSFGFGGTNAHVIMASAAKALRVAASGSVDALVISAACREGLAALANRHAELIEKGVDPARLADAVARGRGILRHRAVLPLGPSTDAAAELRAFALGKNSASIISGTALGQKPRTCFVYSGNGAQWSGMGREAYAANANFRATFDAVDATFGEVGFGSLRDMMDAPDLADRLGSAGVAQPLLFAIQAALTAALAAKGLTPSLVLGHSVGEIAAAYAAGILDLPQAVRLLAARTHSQEAVRGAGAMATFATDRATMQAIAQAFDPADLVIAADNAPASVTLSGTKEAIAKAMKIARGQRIASRQLDIDYPYHSPLLDTIREPFLMRAGPVAPRQATIAMISSVSGQPVADALLDPSYWWQNIRSEVLFRQAVQTAAQMGSDLFVEIGPRNLLTGAVAASAGAPGHAVRVVHTLSDGVGDGDPVSRAYLRAVANGASWRGPESAGSAPVDRTVPLPEYPWQRRTYRYEHSSAAIDILAEHKRHPLIGARLAQGSPEWRAILDADLVPYLADHKVGGEIVVPATALAEMALAAARDVSPDGALCIEDFDIVQALVLPLQGQREVSLRYSGASGDLEIHFRTRFAADEWTLCARGRVAVAAKAPSQPPMPETRIPHDDPSAIYNKADEAGIAYGPAFRLYLGMEHDDSDLAIVHLAEPVGGLGAYSREQILHPVSFDAAFHGLFDRLETVAHARRAWVPIRFERLSVWRDGATIHSAVVAIDKNSSTLKTVSIWLRDADEVVVAHLSRGSLRPVTLSQEAVAQPFYHLATVPDGMIDDGERLFQRVVGHFETLDMPSQHEGWLLLRAHLRAVAHAALSGLVDQHRLWTPSRDGSAEARAILPMVSELAMAGLLKREDNAMRLAPMSDLPEPDVILATVAATYPLASADVALSAQAGDASATSLTAPRSALVARHAANSLAFAPAFAALAGALDALIGHRADVPLHILAEERLLPWVQVQVAQSTGRLSIGVADATAAERLSRRAGDGVAFDVSDVSALGRASADVLLMFVSGNDEPDLAERLAGMASLLRPGGVLVLASLDHDAVIDFQLGSMGGGGPIDRAAERAVVERAGFDALRVFSASDKGLVLYAARKSAEPVRRDAEIRCRLIGGTAAPGVTAHLAEQLPFTADADCAAIDAAGDTIRLVGGAPGPVARSVGSTLIALRDEMLAHAARPARGRFWVVAMPGRIAIDANASALRAFCRVVANEMPELDLRFIEVAANLDAEHVATALAGLVRSPGREREFRLNADRVDAMRLQRGLPFDRAVLAQPPALQLDFPNLGMLENFQWRAVERHSPAEGEIEIEVIASGLNFRDVMLAMGLLNDDVLDVGLAGAVYGLECAGRVTATGTAVTTHRPGDLVIGFGKNSFASHLTARAESFVALPPDMAPEAGAAIPVAFFTAWYSLVELARLQPGERVLIHGGAGAVGLAAIQIASAIGAEVIATVSAPDKRALARLYGATHLLDSRSLEFADHVRDTFGGVDVVLNSLSGEAMRASFKCLKSRGRFIELGKRDYVANTQIGLRPFRRNLSYFGVDVDEVMALDPAIVARGLKAVMAGFADGTFTPIPCSLFQASEIDGAFRLMQSAGHVGKIVVAAPRVDAVTVAPTDVFQPGAGVRLVVGGTRGFGLETALWLADLGARTVVVASRTGEVDPARDEQVARLRDQGVTFVAEHVDVESRVDVEALISRIAKAHGPISGVYHCAVALKDAMLPDVSSEDVQQVLGAKVAGAMNLDEATRAHPVEHFVLFSSASALVGNLGQSTYAAANGFLEGLARERRALGLPALAVAWGAITDVGLLADRADTLKSLGRVAGVSGMPSARALAWLGTMLAVQDSLSDPVVTCAQFDGGGALFGLPVLKSPTFKGVFSGRTSRTVEAGLSLSEIVAGKSPGEALALMTAVVVEEVAQILRLATHDVDIDASIDSLGMDSLMALELRMSIETKYEIELPVMAVAAVANLRELASRILQTVQATENCTNPSLSAEETALLAIHVGGGGNIHDISDAHPEARNA